MKKDILISLAVGLFGAAIFIALVIALPDLFLNQQTKLLYLIQPQFIWGFFIFLISCLFFTKFKLLQKKFTKNLMEYFYSSVIGYALGSIPSAFLLLKKVKNMDITAQGSGNVGAMNAFEVTRSKTLGFAVMLADAFKGLLSVYLCILFFGSNFIYPALALMFAVFSHCYNPWLKMKGGRGLATAAGGSILLFPAALLVWVLVWFIIYIMKKDIILANVWACIATIIIIFSTADIVLKYSFPRAESLSSLILFSTGLMIIIFIRHVDPFIEFLNNKKQGQ